MAPSGENATVMTPFLCPSSVPTCSRIPTSHSLTVRSNDPEARVLPSDENATETDPIRVSFKGADILLCLHVP